MGESLTEQRRVRGRHLLSVHKEEDLTVLDA